MLATVVGKADPTGKARRRPRDRGKALAGKSTLNRLELTPVGADKDSRYKKIACRTRDVERLFVTLFLQAHARPPERIVLDLDATDDPIHGHQLGRFFHGYYKNYCYLPLYIFCGDHLLCARLRPADIDACGRVGEAPPADRGADPRGVARGQDHDPRRQRVLPRGDHALVRGQRRGLRLGLAQNTRLKAMIAAEQEQARGEFEADEAAGPGRSPSCATGRSRAGAASGGWWPRPSTWPRAPTRGSWSRR